jgi:predicted dehydrogenase
MLWTELGQVRGETWARCRLIPGSLGAGIGQPPRRSRAGIASGCRVTNQIQPRANRKATGTELHAGRTKHKEFDRWPCGGYCEEQFSSISANNVMIDLQPTRLDRLRRMLLLATVGGSLGAWGGIEAAPAAMQTLNQPESIKLITLDPGHFHAALFQKQSLAGVSDTVHVYGPLGPDLLLHLDRIAQFNSRAGDPTHWKLEIHTGHDFLERLFAERPGNVVVISGRNQGKIDRITRLLERGLHVLADKPWIIEAEDLPKLGAALDAAALNGVVGYDAMTQRFEITCLLQKELVNDRAVFGECLTGSVSEPAVRMESVHYLLKEVAGVPSRRPAWFFDVRQQGEGLADVGTHLVDLVQWTLFPGQGIRSENEIRVLDAARWPTMIGREQFQLVTGEARFPDYLASSTLRNPGAGSPIASPEDVLQCYANNSVVYAIRGIHAALTVRWEFAPASGSKDSETAIYRGSQARVEVRQGAEQQFRAELYVVPNQASAVAEVDRALRHRIDLLQAAYPGLSIAQEPERFHVLIPDRYRIGHEEHFALLTRQFLAYVRDPRSVPAWEKLNMLAKYYVTTKGVDLARTRARSSSTANQAK